MITDETFKKELDSALKRQGILKKERNELIWIALKLPLHERDLILDNEEAKASEHESKKRKAKHIPSEFKEQCDFVAWFKSEYPGVVIMSIRNHGTRTPIEKTQQILEGLHPGAADLYIPQWHLWIEFKRIKGGVLSKEQDIFANYVMNECGDWWILAEGCENGKEQVFDFIELSNKQVIIY